MNHVGTGSGVSDWVKAHAELSELARRRAALDWEEGTALLRALRSGAHRQLGHASFAEYVERLFGYKPRATEEKLRTAQALEDLPETNRALRDSELSWSAARELTRVATPGTEREWLGAVLGKTVRQVERLVSGRKPGDRPGDPVRPEARRHVLHFDVSAETFATFREAVAHLRRKSEQPLDDDALLLLIAREILHGPSDEGCASYQLAITTCEQCAQGFQQGAGELLPIEPEIVEMARCDAQDLGVVSASVGPHVGARTTQSIPPALRRRVMRRDQGRCVVPGCHHSTFVDLHHLALRSEGGAHSADNLVVVCAAHHRALHRGRGRRARRRLLRRGRTRALEIARLAISSAVLALVSGSVVGCNSCDLPQFDPGTRFLVTVQNDESVCAGSINFFAGETFEIVAGKAARSPGDACETNHDLSRALSVSRCWPPKLKGPRPRDHTDSGSSPPPQ